MYTITYNQPVQITLKAIGGKWKLLILLHLGNEILRFNELKKRISPITQKVLAKELRELESDRLIKRKMYAVIPPKVEYSITKRGKSLQGVLQIMKKWGQEQTRRE